MKQFKGFSARTRYTPIPNLFFSGLLPQIDDIAELKATLYIFWSIYSKKGYPRFVTYGELLGDSGLMSSLGGDDNEPEEALHNALDKAVKRGTVLHLVTDKKGKPEDIYFINTEADRRTVEKIRNGEFALAGLKSSGQAATDANAGELPITQVSTLNCNIRE